jgi:hypothetical protein
LVAVEAGVSYCAARKENLWISTQAASKERKKTLSAAAAASGHVREREREYSGFTTEQQNNLAQYRGRPHNQNSCRKVLKFLSILLFQHVH